MNSHSPMQRSSSIRRPNDAERSGARDGSLPDGSFTSENERLSLSLAAFFEHGAELPADFPAPPTLPPKILVGAVAHAWGCIFERVARPPPAGKEIPAPTDAPLFAQKSRLQPAHEVWQRFTLLLGLDAATPQRGIPELSPQMMNGFVLGTRAALQSRERPVRVGPLLSAVAEGLLETGERGVSAVINGMGVDYLDVASASKVRMIAECLGSLRSIGDFSQAPDTTLFRRLEVALDPVRGFIARLPEQARPRPTR